MFRDWGELGKYPYAPIINSHISISSTKQKSIFSCAWVLPWVRAVPGWKRPEVNINKLWHRIKGRDIVLLGKQCLIAIMICGSAACRHAEPHSEVEAQPQPWTCLGLRADWWSDQRKKWTRKWTGRGQTGELQQPALHSDEPWKAVEQHCG